MTVAPTQNLSSSSGQIIKARSRSVTQTSTPSTDTPWQNIALLFSALSYEESTSPYSANLTSTRFFIDKNQTLPAIYEREDPTAWLDHAKCQGLPGQLFYAEYQHNNSQVQEAKSVCLGTHPDHPGRCPVLEDCLNYAIANGERYGVWGGTSERERRRIKRQRHREAALANGNVIAITTGHRQRPEDAPGYDQAGHEVTWRYQKAALDALRAEWAENRRTASL